MIRSDTETFNFCFHSVHLTFLRNSNNNIMYILFNNNIMYILFNKDELREMYIVYEYPRKIDFTNYFLERRGRGRISQTRSLSQIRPVEAYTYPDIHTRAMIGENIF